MKQAFAIVAAALSLLTLGTVPAALARDTTRARVEKAMADLAHADPAKRVAAAKVLAASYPEGACGVPLLEVCVRDESEKVVAAATAAIRELATRGARDLTAFLTNTKNPQNRAFDKARRYIAKRGARAAPWDLAEIEGRDARCVRLVLTRDLGPPDMRDKTLHLIRNLLASDAGTFAGTTEKLLPLDQRKLACACVAIHGTRSLPGSSSVVLPSALPKLADHADETVRWGALRLVDLLGTSDPKLRAQIKQAWPSAPQSPFARQPLEELLADLPDPSKPLRPDALDSIGMTLLFLDAKGKDAAPAVPKMKAIVKAVKADKRFSRTSLHYSLIGLLCRLDPDSQALVEDLILGLETTRPDGEWDAHRATDAAEALALCAGDIQSAWSRTRIAKAAARIYSKASILAKPPLFRVLMQLERDAQPALNTLVDLLREAETEHRASFDEVSKRKKIPRAKMRLFDVFLGDLMYFGGRTEARHAIAIRLADWRPLPKAERAKIEALLKDADPLLACALAAALR